MNTDTSVTRAVVVERNVPHSLDKVWRALTQGPLLEAWLMANDFEPVAGGVLVRMEQSGFREQDQRNFMGAKYGWERNLGQLEAVVARLA